VNRTIAATLTGLTAGAALAGCATGATAPDPQTRAHADGAYAATGQYGELPSRITVSLTLDEAVITAVDVTTHATDPTSLEYQRRFAEAVPALVVGRPIDEVRLDHVAGSSGTPDGFNDALAQIRQEAASR
jgi:hypothetical protein